MRRSAPEVGEVSCRLTAVLNRDYVLRSISQEAGGLNREVALQFLNRLPDVLRRWDKDTYNFPLPKPMRSCPRSICIPRCVRKTLSESALTHLHKHCSLHCGSRR